MRTNVQLDGITALLEGHHENPSEILGPHEIQQEGRRALAIRAFLPTAKQAWVLHSEQNNAKPMRRSV